MKESNENEEEEEVENTTETMRTEVNTEHTYNKHDDAYVVSRTEFHAKCFGCWQFVTQHKFSTNDKEEKKTTQPAALISIFWLVM